MTTTPRDAIAGLSDRLRHLVSLNRTENGGPYQGYAAAECVSAMSEAATQLGALHKELAQTQAHLAIRNGDLAEAVRERDSHQERVKELEDGRVQALACCDSYANENQSLHDRMEAAESRATRAEQERDEALERAAKVAENPPQPLGRGHACIATGRLIAAAIRRLAAGPDREKRE